MTIEDTGEFDRQLLAAVRRLTAGGAGGVSGADTMSLMESSEAGGLDAVRARFPGAVDRLRQHGLLMSNPTGHLRLTSAGQQHMSQPDGSSAPVAGHEPAGAV